MITFRYYVREFLFGLLATIILLCGWLDEPDNTRMQIVAVLAVISCPLYPLSVLLMENLALRFIRREILYPIIQPGGYNLSALFGVFCFVFTLPVILAGVLFGSLLQKNRSDTNVSVDPFHQRVVNQRSRHRKNKTKRHNP